MAKNLNLKWAQDHFRIVSPKYDKYDQYYRGEQPIRVSDEVKKAFTALLGDTRDNLCPLVCDTLSDRLTLEGFSATDEKVNAWLTDLWESLKVESRSADIHADATRLGDAYVMVWPDPVDPSKPRIYIQDNHNIAVRYEDNGNEKVIVEAVKCWTTKDSQGRDILRVNRYLPDRIQRFYSDKETVIPESTEDLQPFLEEGQWEYANLYGLVLVFRFPNSLKADWFAQSELTDVIPLQDMLNKTMADMGIGEEFEGLPLRWATGLTVPLDPNTGKPATPFKNGGDRIWTVGDTEVKFGQFESADLEQFLKVLNDYRLEIARVSRTPAHLMMINDGDYPSGKALRTAEAPLVSKVKKRQSYYGEVWESIVQACAKIAGVSLDGIKIEPIWCDAATPDTSEELDNMIKKKQIGLPLQQILREEGKSEDDIAKIMSEVEDNSVKTAEIAAASFNAGRGV